MFDTRSHIKALRAIADHFENVGSIPSEDHVAEWIGVRPSEAIDVIDEMAGAGHIELGDPAQLSTFGSRTERFIFRVTRRGEEYLEDAA